MARRSPFQRLSMRIMGEKSGYLDLARGRIVLVTVLFMIGYIVIAARLVDATLIEGYLRDRSEATEEQVPKKAESNKNKGFRADITDRNGVLLATSLKTASLYADAKFILDPKAAATGLTKIFPELTYGDVLKKLQSNKRFIWIKRNMTPQEQTAVLELGEPGLVFDYSYHRIYPEGPLAGHMVGYTDIDGRGLAGVERSFNNLLSDSDDPLRLTLDIRLQHILRREVKRAMTDFTGIGGAGVIMDVNSGEILAATSLPDFDPNAANTNPMAPDMFNRVTLGTYELGSTFKIFTTAALLDQKRTPFAHKFDATKPIKEGGHTIHDYHAENKMLTLPEVFMVSSNIGTAKMAQEIGTAGLKSMFADLGLLKKMDFEIDEVAAPIIPSPWREINTLTASYGHGIAVTPLQMVSAVSSIVNGGIKVTPKLVMDAGSNKKESEQVRVVSKETSLKMRQLMRLVVSHGTGKKANVPGYYIGGKTGTADKNINGRYIGDKRMAIFVGVFPINDPQYAVMVLVDEPHPNKGSYGYATAGWVAAPAAGRIVNAMGSLIGMSPQENMTDISEPLKQFIADVKEGN